MAFLTEAANRGSIATGYNIDNSCMFDWNGTNTAGNGQSYMYDTSWTGTPTSTTTGCFSTWFKNSLSNSTNSLGVASFVNNYSDGNNRSYIMGDWGSGGNFVFGQKVSGSWNFRVVSNALYRDPAAHYHFFAVWDTSNSTESERIRLYVNGERITSLSDQIYPSQNQECYIVSKEDFSVGRAYSSVYGNFTHGYMAETHFVDGTAYAPTDFGEFDEDSGIWKPKQVSVSYGNKGFYLDYKDASNLGNDASGNNRDLTLSDINSTNQATDTPTNNFCTLNPIHVYSPAALPTISNGGTKLTTTYQAWWTTAVANMAITSGKWYFEARSATSSTHLSAIGYGDEADIENWGIDRNANRQCHVGRTHSGGVQTKSYAYIGSDTEGASYGRIFPNGTSPSTRVNYIYTDVIGVAIDADNGYAYWHKNGTYINSGNPTSGSSGTGGYAVPSGTGTNGTLIPAVGAYYHSSIGVIEVNFGGYTEMSISSAASDANGYGTFEYAPPSGYYALCTKNLAEYG